MQNPVSGKGMTVGRCRHGTPCPVVLSSTGDTRWSGGHDWRLALARLVMHGPTGLQRQRPVRVRPAAMKTTEAVVVNRRPTYLNLHMTRPAEAATTSVTCRVLSWLNDPDARIFWGHEDEHRVVRGIHCEIWD